MFGWAMCREQLVNGWQSLRQKWSAAVFGKLPQTELLSARILVQIEPQGQLVITENTSGQKVRAQWPVEAEELQAAEGVAAAVRGVIDRQGWQDMPLALQLPASWCMGLLTELPAGLNAQEQREAAYWEMADQLQSSGLQPEQYAIASVGLQADTVWTAALPQARLTALRTALQTADLELVRMFVQGADEAAEVVFWQKQTTPRYVRYLRWGLAVVVLLCAGFLLGRDLCVLYAARQARQSAEQQLAELATAQKAMTVRQGVRQRAQAKAQILQELSAQRSAWYSLLVHLGTLVPDGIWVEQLQLQPDGSCQLKGRATDYLALTGFLQACGREQAVFPQGVELAESRQEADGSISFQLKL